MAHLMLQVLFSIAIFTSAFLLFFLQPLLAKHITPQFGGSSFVWITSLLFFQAALLIGYSYAFLLTRYFSEKNQALFHFVMLVISLYFIPIELNSDLTISNSWPPLTVIHILSSSILLPFVILSASSPLLQHWYCTLRHTTYPYVYYSISNAGSLLGLIGYPLLLEPLIGLKRQAVLSSSLYVIYAILCCFCLFRLYTLKNKITLSTVKSASVKSVMLIKWLILSLLGSALLLSTTQFLTQNVINAPLIWILPLALYLISFISTFATPKGYEREFWIPIFCVFLILILKNIYLLTLNGTQLVIFFLGLLYSGCLICHGELIRLKPELTKLTLFYLIIALGGVLGGCFAQSLSLLFTSWWNWYIPVVTINVIAIMISFLLYKALQRKKDLIICIFALSTLILFFIVTMLDEISPRDKNLVTQQRNLYGLLRVYDIHTKPGLEHRVLMHGTVVHGLEYLAPEKQLWPTSYYHLNSGASLAIQFMHKHHKQPLQIAVVGLGVGTISALTQANDNVTFYEIDPAVIKIAHQYFHFLDKSPGNSQVVLGDARIQLAAALASHKPPHYDVIIIDAFNGDAIPFHLITQEAVKLYQSLLSPEGIIAFHTSNNFINLMPITTALAQNLQCPHYWLQSHLNNTNTISSTWGLISCNPQVGTWLMQQPGISIVPTNNIKPILWTDDFNSLLPIINLR